MVDQPILLDVRDYIATITINRPEVRNAITNPMIVQITQWLQELRDRDDVRVIILRGAGDKAFCAGHDLKEAAAESRAGGPSGTAVSSVLSTALATYPKPTIAAVRGFVRQAGMWLSSSCDLLIAAEDATFAFTAIRFGMFPAQPMVPVMRRVGRSSVMYMILSGDVLDAHEAKAISLADRVVPVERFEVEVQALASKIASRDPQAVRAGKEALALLVDMDTVKAIQIGKYSNQLQRLAQAGEQGAERIEAHLASVRGTGATRRTYE